jgi:methylmalonyl-CoA mutase cobalamin-binding subunit
LVVDGSVLADYVVPEGGRRPRVLIAAGGRTVSAELNPNSLKKAIATIREHGPEAVAVVLQGNLGPGDVLEAAGIAAQLKGAKPPSA